MSLKKDRLGKNVNNRSIAIEQWAKPSAELLRQRELLANLHQRHPQSSIFDLMAEVGRMTATDRKRARAADR